MQYWVAALVGALTWLVMLWLLGPDLLTSYGLALLVSGIGLLAGLVGAFVYNLCRVDE
jgi:ABC-type enterobactin transport system permease subunit